MKKSTKKTKPSSKLSDGARSTLMKKSAMNAAAKVFAEKGYSGTNLGDVAKLLGISRPGLYYHFSSKEKLIEAIIEEVTISSQRQSSTIAARAELEPQEAVRLVTHMHAKWIMEHAVLFKVVDRSEAELPPNLFKVHSHAKRTVLDNFTNIIDRGIDKGLFRPTDSRVAAFSIIGMCSWTAWWFNPEGKELIDDVAEMISIMALSSIARSDPHRKRNEDPLHGLAILRQDIDHLERLMRKK